MKEFKQNQKELLRLVENLRMPMKESLKCFLGFDGYIDDIYRVVNTRTSKEEYRIYEQIADLGERISLSAGKSTDIEILLEETRIGGNAPNMANGISCLGADTICIGPLNTVHTPNPFTKMSEKCKRISVGECSHTIAFEFLDGKVMFGNLTGNHITWDELRSKVGMRTLYDVIEKSDLICIVNWSGMYHANDILQGLMEEIFFKFPEDLLKEKYIFFDLADPAARQKEDIDKLFMMINTLSLRAKVILGMNENEALQIGKILYQTQDNLQEAGEKIFENLKVSLLAIHTLRQVLGFTAEKTVTLPGLFVEKPVISTGAGDHFNAGICMGILLHYPLNDLLMVGNACASCYVSTGKSPNLYEIANFIDMFISQQFGLNLATK